MKAKQSKSGEGDVSDCSVGAPTYISTHSNQRVYEMAQSAIPTIIIVPFETEVAKRCYEWDWMGWSSEQGCAKSA